MPLQKLQNYLNENRVDYSIRRHPRVYTAMELAESIHVPGNQVAKTVMVKLDGSLAMAVVPANCHVSLQALAEKAGVSDVDLASEDDFINTFPECDVGGMPPFGNLWALPVYVSETLAEDERITFNAGNHDEVMTVGFNDYRRLVHPKIMKFSVPD